MKYNVNYIISGIERDLKVNQVYELIPLKRKSFYSKTKVLRCYGYDYLLSYDTLVARYNYNTNKIERLSDYRSVTTSSHILAFLNQYNDIQTIKDFYKLRNIGD